MPDAKLTAVQADKLVVLRLTLGYLNGLFKRVEQVGFPHDDRLLKLVDEARKSLQDLTIEVHYESCRGQVGREN